MSAGWPPKKNAIYTFYVGLISIADTTLLQNSPTLAAGDVKVSKDGGAFANLTTLPTVTPAAGDAVKVTLSATEMNADDVTVVFSDVAGAEWADLLIHIKTDTNQMTDVALASVATEARLAELDAANLPTDVSAVLTDTGTTIPAQITALNDYDPTAQMTESYAANGVVPTRDECLLAIHQMLMQFGISGTSLTVRKLDNAATAFVVTLDDSTSPTDAKRV